MVFMSRCTRTNNEFFFRNSEIKEFFKIFLLSPHFFDTLSINAEWGQGFVTAAKQAEMGQTEVDETLATLGAEVRQLRKARQMTLADLAKASGVSVSHLSAIERGSVNATLDKIKRIASALDVPEEWFFAFRPGDGPLERTYVVRRDNRRNVNMLYGEPADVCGYSDTLLSSSLGGAFHMGMSEFPPYSDTYPVEIYVREGEAHGLVLEGELELTLEDEVITLREGDSFSFPGDVPHTTRNVSDKPARLIWVNSPVIIPRNAVYRDDGETKTKQITITKRSAP